MACSGHQRRSGFEGVPFGHQGEVSKPPTASADRHFGVDLGIVPDRQCCRYRLLVERSRGTVRQCRIGASNPPRHDGEPWLFCKGLWSTMAGTDVCNAFASTLTKPGSLISRISTSRWSPRNFSWSSVDLSFGSAHGQFRALRLDPTRNAGCRLACHPGETTRYLADRVGRVRDE
jgi:hypothetical protein